MNLSGIHTGMLGGSDPYAFDSPTIDYRVRMDFMLAQPAMVEKPTCELDERMVEWHLTHARACNRPAYHEAAGFTRDRWQLAGVRSRSICGHEAAYGFGRVFWREVWRAMRRAFLAEWHRALGTTYTTPASTDRRIYALITGGTA